MNFVVGWADLRAELGMLFSLRMMIATVSLALAMNFNPIPIRGGGPVDVNRASVAELMTVPGMTDSWAKRIVRFRPYRSKLDLLNEGVVSPDAYRGIRDGIVAHRVKDAK